MEYEVIEDREEKGAWCVQTTGRDEMSPTARFSGRSAKEAAIEYAAWKSDNDYAATLRAVLFSLQIP